MYDEKLAHNLFGASDEDPSPPCTNPSAPQPVIVMAADADAPASPASPAAVPGCPSESPPVARDLFGAKDTAPAVPVHSPAFVSLARQHWKQTMKLDKKVATKDQDMDIDVDKDKVKVHAHDVHAWPDTVYLPEPYAAWVSAPSEADQAAIVADRRRRAADKHQSASPETLANCRRAADKRQSASPAAALRRAAGEAEAVDNPPRAPLPHNVFLEHLEVAFTREGTVPTGHVPDAWEPALPDASAPAPSGRAFPFRVNVWPSGRAFPVNVAGIVGYDQCLFDPPMGHRAYGQTITNGPWGNPVYSTPVAVVPASMLVYGSAPDPNAVCRPGAPCANRAPDPRPQHPWNVIAAAPGRGCSWGLTVANNNIMARIWARAHGPWPIPRQLPQHSETVARAHGP